MDAQMMVAGLISLFVMLQVADALSTILVIRNGGRELNPLLVWFDSWLRKNATHARWAWLLLVKLAVCAVVLIAWRFGVWEGYSVWVLGVVDILYAIVVYHNFSVFRKYK